ncbi:MAG TPA: gamma-glutamylcyclotransferase [Stellaceae bacterium]|nr:gamma-glutamylcyclotransferase [Stellaceae bacterium]
MTAAAGPLPPRIAALCEAARPIWVFAYGSLMWDPGIPHAEAAPALVHGWHRSFCVYSYDYRGTRARPGLVLGLDRGGACRGLALRLSPADAAASLALLWEREMTDLVYDLRPVRARIGGNEAASLAFVVRRDHPDYAGRLSAQQAARLIAGAAGSRGACRDYLAGAIAHLESRGLADAGLARLDRLVKGLAPRQ